MAGIRSGSGASSTPSAFSCRAIRSRFTRSALKRLRATRWADFARSVRAGASTARLGASVLDRYERRARSGGKIGVVQLSDPSGRYEAILFQEGLSQFRDLLEKGADVLVTLQAAVEGEDVRARIVNVERLTEAAAKVQKGLRVFVRDETPLDSIERRLSARGDGEVSLVVILGPRTARSKSACPAAMRSAPRSPARSKRRPAWSRWSRCEAREALAPTRPLRY